MIERRGEHKMFTSPQSLKKPSLFKPLTFPNPHTNSALQRLPTTSLNPHTILSLPQAPPHIIFASKKAKSAMFTNTMLFNSACETETSRRRRLYAENSHSEYIAETHTNEKEIERIAENSLLMPLMRDAWVDGIPAPSTLWHGLWNEGEIACLFGDPNIGKSLLANQIANEAAAMGHQVLYVDFENPDIHFHSRYTTKEGAFASNYGNIRYVGLRFDTAHSASYTIEQKFQAIQDAILVHRTPVVIIDDISHILPVKFSERSQSILHQLRHLAQNWHVAILVLAHTRYHRPDTPLSITHLAGSREFSFAFDSIFALGKVTNELPATDGDALVPTHYIRQFKARAAAITYDEDHVMRLHLNKRPCMELAFQIIDSFGIEAQLITPSHLYPDSEILTQILQLHIQGLSLRQIATQLSISPSFVFRTISRQTARIERMKSSTEANSNSTTESVSGVSGVSGVSSVSSPQTTPAEETSATPTSPIIKALKEMVAATGIPTLATPYIHANSPFKEVFQHPEIFKAHRFSFSCPHYYESLIKQHYSLSQLMAKPSASLQVYDYDINSESPIMRRGTLVYNTSTRQLGILPAHGESMEPYPHVFPEGTTSEMLTQALYAQVAQHATQEEIAPDSPHSACDSTSAPQSSVPNPATLIPHNLLPLIFPKFKQSE